MRRINVLLLVLCTVAFGRAQTPVEVTVRLLAVGDLNLGRHVGQMLLKDSIGFPFQHSREVLLEYDIVFGNLESPISDQKGETRHPTDPYVFCAPPQAAKALKEAGFTALSTANNHALDYGEHGLRETIEYLREAEIAHTGISADSSDTFEPIILERGGITFGFLAYTQFVNGRKNTRGLVSLFEPRRIRREIGLLRKKVDVLIVSFHGGAEYKDAPGSTTVAQMRSLVDRGADVVLGHHPHVPQGIEVYKGKWIFYSLGNFVFYQPQREWTQKSFAAEVTFGRREGKVGVEGVRMLPLRASHQPAFQVEESVLTALLERLRKHTNVVVERKDSVLIAYEGTTH